MFALFLAVTSPKHIMTQDMINSENSIIEEVRICAYSDKFFMELKFSTRSVSVKMYAHQLN